MLIELAHSEEEKYLQIVVKMIQDDISKFFNFMYEDFIKSISPSNGATNVQLDADICINIGVNLFNYTLLVFTYSIYPYIGGE
jgi:hypothetical protein